MAGTTKRTYRKAAEKREAVLAATRQLLVDNPDADLTIREIGEAAGTNHSEIIRLFGSKAALTQQVVVSELLTWAGVCAEQTDPVESFMAGYRFLFGNPTVALLGRAAAASGSPHLQESYPVIDTTTEICVAAGMDREVALELSAAMAALLPSVVMAWRFYAAAMRRPDEADVVEHMVESQVRAGVTAAMEKSS